MNSLRYGHSVRTLHAQNECKSAQTRVCKKNTTEDTEGTEGTEDTDEEDSPPRRKGGMEMTIKPEGAEPTG
jgi:hypothetical protein